MVSRLKLNIILGISCVIWFAVMGVIYRDHYIRKVQPELSYFSSDVSFKSEEKQYFKITQNGNQIGFPMGEADFSIFRREKPQNAAVDQPARDLRIGRRA